jgi:hypothetical protein
MSYPREHMKRALWHAKAAIGSLQKAADASDIDIDAPVEESGLIPPPPDDDLDFPDHIEPTAPLDPALDNPQSRHRAALRLVRALASYR